MPDFGLDAIDRRILDRLQENGRVSNVELANDVGISSSPCWRRVRELEQRGVISGYVALVDAAAVGGHRASARRDKAP